ncbi:MAG: hypothetical protein HC803_00225 [Saprospiraceae bacterium]|nr:hypothetical protein [Saprospiraceae bacterium]
MNWTVSRPGLAIITVFVNGKEYVKQNYRVKRVPDPVIRLRTHDSGTLSLGEFKAQEGLSVFLDNFDFDASCEIVGFTMVFVRKNSDVFDVVNKGESFNENTRKRMNEVQIGDTIYFEKIRCRCPGDEIPRELNTVVIRIQS